MSEVDLEPVNFERDPLDKDTYSRSNKDAKPSKRKINLLAQAMLKPKKGAEEESDDEDATGKFNNIDEDDNGALKLPKPNNRLQLLEIDQNETAVHYRVVFIESAEIMSQVCRKADGVILVDFN